MKVLILSCNTGGGHNSCAKAIGTELLKRGHTYETDDALLYVSKGTSRFVSSWHVRFYRGATLVHGLSLFPGRALCRVPSYPRQLTYALTSWNTPWQPIQCSCPGLTTPSAVHLTTCFLPDSQQHGLSGKASSPLSPLQRFFVVFWYTTFFNPCQRGNVRFVILIPTRDIG